MQNEAAKVLQSEMYLDINSQIESRIQSLKDDLKVVGGKINKMSSRVLAVSNASSVARTLSQSLNLKKLKGSNEPRSTDRNQGKNSFMSLPKRDAKRLHSNERSLPSKINT